LAVEVACSRGPFQTKTVLSKPLQAAILSMSVPHGSPCSGTWKKNWFVLSEHVLYYFDSPGEDKPKLTLPMDSVRVGR